MSDPAFQRVLARYAKRIEEEAVVIKRLSPQEFGARRDEFLLDVGEEVGRFLVDLVLGSNAKIIVELGTSYGYSTLHFADAARRTGGKVFTYDIAAEKQAYARTQLADAGLAEFVEFKLGDATRLLADQKGPVDLVLIDIWKDLYIPCLEAVYPKLGPTGIIVADNMTHPPLFKEDAAKYRAAVRAKPDMEGVLLHIGNGIDVSSRTRMRG